MPRGDAARAALVASAERLFALRGVEAVSLRDVCADAGQRNHSAAQYHFGDRAGLVGAVYENRMRHVDRRRGERLAVLGEDDVRGLVEALVVPLVEVVDETAGWYARFLARTRWDPAAWQVVLAGPSTAGFAAAMRRLDRALRDGPGLDPAVRRSRLDQLLTLVVGTLAGWEGAPDRGEARLAAPALAAELVETGLAVLTAPARQPAGAPA